MALTFYHLTAREGLHLYTNGHINYITENAADSLTLEETFQMMGTYVFDDGEEISAELHELWLRFGDELAAVWLLERGEVSAIQAIFCSKVSGAWTVRRQWGFRFSNYSLNVSPGVKVSCVDCGLQFSGTSGSPIAFEAHGLVFSALDREVLLPVEPVDDRENGVFRFQTESAGGIGQENLLERIDAGVRYSAFAGHADPEEAAAAGFTDTLYNSVLHIEGSISFECSFNPSRPEDAATSYLRIPQNLWVGSAFTSLSGSPVGVRTTDKSFLVFSRTATNIIKSDEQYLVKTRYYLSFAGRFLVTGDLFLPGLSGTEYVDMTLVDEQERMVEFLPGYPGFIGANGELCSQATVSWLNMPKGAEYYCQPKPSPLFAVNASGAFVFLPLPLLVFDQDAPAPVMFYRQCKSNLTQTGITDFPIYDRRYREFAAAADLQTSFGNAESAGETFITAVTPQGMLVGISGNNAVCENWQWVALANCDVTGKTCKYMKLIGIDKHLRLLFQNADMSIVLTNSSDLVNHIEEIQQFEFEIEGWNFRFDPGDWRTTGDAEDTVMVIKHSQERSLRTLLEGQAANIFARSLEQCYQDDGEERGEYREFLNVIDDVYFQGLVFLNCRVMLDKGSSGIDDALRTLLSGIDEMTAHNIILYKSRVEVENNEIRLGKTSISAVVDYKSGQQLTYDREREEAAALKYSTTEFTLVVNNSEITRITSTSELLINKLFCSPCRKTDGSEGGNCLIIDGVKTKGELDGFRFSLRAGGEYELSQGVLLAVAVESVTLTTHTEGGVFCLGGKLYFATNADCDLFSYGKAVRTSESLYRKPAEVSWNGEEDCGLRFDSFKIYLSRIEGEDDRLWLSYEDIVFMDSEPRNNSFAERFPSEIRRLIYEPDSSSPVDKGYAAIEAPVSQSVIAEPWFGLLWRIPLGTLGELSDSSVFDIDLLLAWSTGAEPGLFIGAKLPAALGGAGLDLQGILKLGFKSVVLEVQKHSDLVQYALLFKSFMVRVLWVSFPKGSADIRVMADESGKKLGWYAAYTEDNGSALLRVQEENDNEL